MMNDSIIVTSKYDVSIKYSCALSLLASGQWPGSGSVIRG